jgi:hypothetical protein
LVIIREIGKTGQQVIDFLTRSSAFRAAVNVLLKVFQPIARRYAFTILLKYLAERVYGPAKLPLPSWGSMTAYCNEIDPYAAQWLRNLIAAGHIAPGDVDERDIRDVRPSDLLGYRQCHFFAGIGVWSYALRRAGWPDNRPVWTGSEPCQPFSAAGSGKGFADERFLRPFWQHLIRVC